MNKNRLPTTWRCRGCQYKKQIKHNIYCTHPEAEHVDGLKILNEFEYLNLNKEMDRCPINKC